MDDRVRPGTRLVDIDEQFLDSSSEARRSGWCGRAEGNHEGPLPLGGQVRGDRSHQRIAVLPCGRIVHLGSEQSIEQRIAGGDLTLRYKPGTYVKVEGAASDGAGSGALSSQNGGFDFGSVAQTTTAGIDARAQRVEAVIDLQETGTTTRPASVSAYGLKRDDGYSAPGQLTNEGVDQAGRAGLPEGRPASGRLCAHTQRHTAGSGVGTMQKRAV